MSHSIGPYQVERELGRGGTGVVFQVVGPDHRRYALKLLDARSAADDERRLRRIAREIDALRRINHPGVVRAFDSGIHGNSIYVVLELVSGDSLQDRLRAGPLPPRRAAELCATRARTVHDLHQAKILHRDVKPDNVLLEGERPRLTDLGLVYFLDHHEQLTRTGATVGTPGYCAPELLAVESAQRVGPAVDIYGLGATLYALLTGGPPFAGNSAYEVAVQTVERAPRPPSESRADRGEDRELLRALDAVCLRCLAKDPRERYFDARALAEDLELILGGAHQAKGSPLGPLLLALAGAALGVGLTLWALPRSTSDAEPEPSAALASPAPQPTAAPDDPSSPGPTPPREGWPARGPADLAALGPFAGPLWEVHDVRYTLRRLAGGVVGLEVVDPSALRWSVLPREGPGLLHVAIELEIPAGAEVTAGLVYGFPQRGVYRGVSLNAAGTFATFLRNKGQTKRGTTLGGMSGKVKLAIEEEAEGGLMMRCQGMGLGMKKGRIPGALGGVFFSGPGEVRIHSLSHELVPEEAKAD